MKRRSGKAFHKLLVSTIPGVKAAPYPGFIEPNLATTRSKVPTGAGWLYEIKLDGYRTQLHWRNKRATMFTRSALDWTKEFAPIAEAAAELAADQVILDGEVVVQNEDGVPDFHALRRAIFSAPERLVFFAFDLLYLDGYDLRGAALSERRRVLEQLLKKPPGGRIHLSEASDGPGDELFDEARAMKLEGIVAKRASSPYRSARTDSWIKVKCLQTLTLPVIGFIPAGGGAIAALRLGRQEGNELVYAGKVGTGFSQKTAQTVRQRLEPLMRRTPPLAKPLRKKDTIWVEPKLSAKVEILELTDDGYVRQASFKGLSE
jgi:bifunctional non-homologous end joining protein LigD